MPRGSTTKFQPTHPSVKENVTERSNTQLFAQHLPSTCFPTGSASVLMSRFRSQWRKQHRGWPPVSVKSRDWLKRSTVRTWLRTAIHGTRDSTSRADMKKKIMIKIKQDDSNFSHFWLSQRLWSSLSKTLVTNTKTCTCGKKKQHVPTSCTQTLWKQEWT